MQPELKKPSRRGSGTTGMNIKFLNSLEGGWGIGKRNGKERKARLKMRIEEGKAMENKRIKGRERKRKKRM